MIIGEGRGVTIAVVVTAFVLFLLLIVTMVLGFEKYGPKLVAAVERARSAPVQHDADTRAASTEDRAAPTEPGLPDGLITGDGAIRIANPVGLVRPVPPPERALAGATARIEGNPGVWFSNDAYPVDAIRRSEQGRTVAKLLVDATGAPTKCIIASSSNSASLDMTTCSILMAHATFKPARDRNGVATVGDYTVPVRWVLPED